MACDEADEDTALALAGDSFEFYIEWLLVTTDAKMAEAVDEQGEETGA